MLNPNPYDDDKFSAAALKIVSGIRGLWEAGGTINNLEDVIQGELMDIGFREPEVEISHE